MRKLFILMALGLMTILSLTPFVYADPIPNFGPQTYQLHKYYYFGDTNFNNLSRQGLDLSVDSSSLSFQSTKATLTMDHNIINDRQITKFVILANGVAVDAVEPYFDTSLSPATYSEYYYLDINISTQYIGSDVYFQVIGLREDALFNSTNNVYVVAWSTQTPTYHFKPLPVTDADTHGLITQSNSLLQQILDKLQNLQNMLAQMLSDLTQAVKDIYTIKPETQTRFDNALNDLQSKLPTEQVKDNLQQVENMMQESQDRINQTPQGLTFGDIPWMEKYTGMRTALLDFTDFADYIDKLRLILQVTLWCEFFYGVMLILRPRLTI